MTDSPTVLGLDLSSTSSGVCAAGDCLTIKPKGELLTRARAMRDDSTVYTFPADLIVMEAIGTQHVNTAIAIATVHALVLDQIADGSRIVKVPPSVLKKYATGKGNANKDAMLLAATRDGSTCENNDEADAWWLWCIGMHLLDAPVVAPTQYRLDVLEKLTIEEPA